MVIFSFMFLSRHVFTETKPHKGILAVTTTTTVLLRRRRQTRARTDPLKSSRCHSSCFSVTIQRRGYFTQNIVSQQKQTNRVNTQQRGNTANPKSIFSVSRGSVQQTEAGGRSQRNLPDFLDLIDSSGGAASQWMWTVQLIHQHAVRSNVSLKKPRISNRDPVPVRIHLIFEEARPFFCPRPS